MENRLQQMQQVNTTTIQNGATQSIHNGLHTQIIGLKISTRWPIILDQEVTSSTANAQRVYKLILCITLSNLLRLKVARSTNLLKALKVIFYLAQDITDLLVILVTLILEKQIHR